jgi:hypothetical protein
MEICQQYMAKISLYSILDARNFEFMVFWQKGSIFDIWVQNDHEYSNIHMYS